MNEENNIYSIEEKINSLPVVAYGESVEFQNIINSELFNDIFEYYSANYSNDKLKSKSILQQKVSLYLYLTNQDEGLADNIQDLIYKRPFPDIEEFLDNPFYMGNVTSTLYPYWRKKLCEIFSHGSSVRKVLWSGATGCLTKDTKVVTLSGEYETIEDLYKNGYEGKYVLSFNTRTKTWEPDRILDVFYSGVDTIYEIKLDNGEIIKATSNHRFLTRNNKWVSINTGLKPGMSMMPNYSRVDKKGYIEVKNNITEKYEKRYKIVGNWKGLVRKNIAIHHKDFNKKNDNPSNLCLINYNDHYAYHAKKGGDRWREINTLDKYKETRHKRSLNSWISKTKNPNFEEIELNRKRTWLYPDSDKQTKAVKSKWINNYEYNKEQAINSIVNYNKSEKGRAISAINAAHMRDLLNNKTEEEKNLINIKKGFASIKKLGPNHEKYIAKLEEIRQYEPDYDPNETSKQRWKRKHANSQYNHKIVSITELGEEHVYDIETEFNNNFALYAGIVAHNTGKSRTAEKATVYCLYRLLCLRHPRSILNVETSSTLAVFILSVTQKTAYQVLFQPFIELLSNMPCFQRVRNMKAFDNFDTTNPRSPIPFYVEKGNMTIIFPDNIILTLGSQISNTVGYDIVISMCDELNEKGTEEGMELINSIDGRIDGRFMGSEFIFQNVMSSARAKNSVTSEYNKKWKHDPSFLYLRPMRFEVKTADNFIGDKSECFYVMAGNGIIPSKIVYDESEIRKIKQYEEESNFDRLGLLDFELVPGCELVKVPQIYYPSFESALEQSIQDILGISTQDDALVFRDTSKIVDLSLIPELKMEINLGENVKLLDYLPESMFDKDINGNYRLKRCPNAPRYFALDLSSSGNQCDTGLCMLHKEYYKNEITNEKDIIYVVDFIAYGVAKTKIDIESVKQFPIDLVRERGIPIRCISADQYQSLLILQSWEASKCFKEVKKLSVDIKLEPYTNAAALVEKGKVKIGQCNKLKKEMESLIIENGKVNKTTELKDMTDVLCASLYNAQLEFNDLPQYEYIPYDKDKVKNKITYKDYLKDDIILQEIF